MTTHWIIGIGSPKLRVMSGNAILTAVSSGTTEMPSPTSISRSHGHATAGAGAATPFTDAGIASSRYRGMRIDPLACCVAGAHHISPGTLVSFLVIPAEAGIHSGVDPGLPHGSSPWAKGPRDDNQGYAEMIDKTSGST